MAFPKNRCLKAIPDKKVLRLKSTEPPEVVISEKTGCGSVCKQRGFFCDLIAEEELRITRFMEKGKLCGLMNLGLGLLLRFGRLP